MISIVIPMYNEGRRISATLREIEIFTKENPGLVGEVVVVDDGSRDNCVERAAYFMMRLPLRIERFVENRGKWAALHHGMSVARYDALLLLDADGSASIGQLERIEGLKWVLQQKINVFGSRFLSGAEVKGKSMLRVVVSQCYRIYARWLRWYATGKWDIDDLQCPFKLIYKSMIDVRKLQVERFAGDIEVACLLSGKKRNVPIEFVHKAGSRVKPSSVFDMAWETFRTARRMRRLLKGGRISLLEPRGSESLVD